MANLERPQTLIIYTESVVNDIKVIDNLKPVYLRGNKQNSNKKLAYEIAHFVKRVAVEDL